MGCSQSLIAGCLVLSLCGCSTLETTPQKFSLSKAGYASVERAPATAAETPPRSESAGFGAEMWRFRAQQEYAQEAQALQAKLRAEEPGNFSELRIEWEPEFHYLVSFRQDAAATLAQHTSNPIFKPNTVKYTPEMLEAKSKEVFAAISSQKLSASGNTDVLLGKVIIRLGIYEEQVAKYPSLTAFKNDPMVQLKFNTPLEPSEAVSDDVEGFIRYFAREKSRNQAVLTSLTKGRVLLKDGCFFLEGRGGDDRLIVFQEQMGVGRDEEGYIVLINRLPNAGLNRQTRVGERAGWGDGIRAVRDPEIITPLQKACGAHDAVVIGAPSPYEDGF